MRRIAILNQKGGVGKTTTAVNLAAAAAAAGTSTCLIDLDPQAHASLHLGVALARHEPSLYDVLTSGTSLAEVRRAMTGSLWLAPAQLDLAAAELELAGMVGRELIVREKLAADSDAYQLAVFDCPPSLGILTLNALAAVDEVYIPLQPHFLALHGLGKLLETIELVALRINPGLKVAGVILCLYDAGTRLAAEVARDAEEFLARERGKGRPWSEATVCRTRVRRNIRLAEAPSFGQSIFDYADDSHGAEDYRRLAEEMGLTSVAAERLAA